MTKDQLAAVVKPLHTVSAALGEARSAMRQGRPAGLDLDGLRDQVDGVIADLMAAQGEEIVRTLAVRSANLADDLTAAYSGMTMDPVALVAGLHALRGGLDLVERMLDEAGERRPAA